MILIQIVLGIVATVCFFEYNHLRKNNIRHDEQWFLYFGIILVIALIFTFFI